MNRAEALDTLQRNIQTTREALDVIKATHPLRPLVVIESEAKRGESGTVEKLILSPAENGAASAPAPTPARELPTRCAECGTELMPHEAKRTDAGKFTLLCDDCTRLALGLI